MDDFFHYLLPTSHDCYLFDKYDIFDTHIQILFILFISGEHPLHARLLREEVRDSVQRQCGNQIFLN